MPITIKYAGSPALSGLAAFAGGQAKYRQEQQRAWMPIVAQQQQMRFEQQQALQRQGFQLEAQGRGFAQENALVKTQQDWRSGEAEKGRTFQTGEGQLERDFRTGEAEAQRGWLREGQGLEFQQQQQRDLDQFGRQRQLQADDWQGRIEARRDEGLMSGEFYYSDEQKRQMQELESAAVNIQNNAMLDADQKKQALGQLRQKHDTIRNSPQTARGDQRAMTPQQRMAQNFQVTPTGERLFTQPDGQAIQLRPEPSPAEKQAEIQRTAQEKTQVEIDKLEAEIDKGYETYGAQRRDDGTKVYTDEEIGSLMARKEERLKRLQSRMPGEQTVGGWDGAQSGMSVQQAPAQIPGPAGGAGVNVQRVSPDGKYVWDGSQWRPR